MKIFNDHLLGYQRSDGKYGIRNYVVLLAAADNVNPVIYKLGKLYPEIVCIPATFGRGQMGEDLELATRTLAGIAGHPNVFAALVISFEPGSADRILSRVSQDRCVKSLSILEVGGFSKTVKEASMIIEDFFIKANYEKRVPLSIENLTVGLECGGSDTTSGLIANPVVGKFVDNWIDSGGSAVFSEPVELIGCENLLEKRVFSPEIAGEIRNLINQYKEIALEAGVDLVGINPTSDNIAGGLSSIEEKSLGALAKTGSKQIQGVLKYGEVPKHKGLWLMDAPAAAVENLTALTAGGCQVTLFTTGSVNPVGSPISPTIKICANPHSIINMGEHIDVDLSKRMNDSLTNKKAIELVQEKLFNVIKGEKTCSEKLGYVETRISRIGFSV